MAAQQRGECLATTLKRYPPGLHVELFPNLQRGDVIKSATGDIPIVYKLRKRSDGWFVYDVEIENVSMVSTYRETYRSVVRKDGMDGLLLQMRTRITELEAQADLGPAA